MSSAGRHGGSEITIPTNQTNGRMTGPPPGRALVCVSDDTRLLEAAAEALTRGGGKASLDSFSGEARFEHAKGAVFAYPADKAGPCEPRRDVSHE